MNNDYDKGYMLGLAGRYEDFYNPMQKKTNLFEEGFWSGVMQRFDNADNEYKELKNVRIFE